ELLDVQGFGGAAPLQVGCQLPELRLATLPVVEGLLQGPGDRSCVGEGLVVAADDDQRPIPAPISQGGQLHAFLTGLSGSESPSRYAAAPPLSSGRRRATAPRSPAGEIADQGE